MLRGFLRFYEKNISFKRTFFLANTQYSESQMKALQTIPLNQVIIIPNSKTLLISNPGILATFNPFDNPNSQNLHPKKPK